MVGAELIVPYDPAEIIVDDEAIARTEYLELEALGNIQNGEVSFVIAIAERIRMRWQYSLTSQGIDYAESAPLSALYAVAQYEHLLAAGHRGTLRNADMLEADYIAHVQQISQAITEVFGGRHG
jgi:hypothetical protein